MDATIQELQKLWDAETRVVAIIGNRHTVLFPGREVPTQVTFCNVCGESFMFGNLCAHCGTPQKSNATESPSSESKPHDSSVE